MHLNYFFLKKLVPELAKAIEGQSFIGAFSQDKDEIVLEFGQDSVVTFIIRAVLKTDFTSLYFPERFERARANSVDLFRGLNALSVTEVRMYENERAFRLVFENGSKLVFKLFGNRSNLLYFDQNGHLITVFNRRLSGDLTLDESSLSRPLDQSFERFHAEEGDYRKMFPTFGAQVNQYLSVRFSGVTSLEEKWSILQETLAQLDLGQYYLTIYQGVIALSLLPVGEVQEDYEDPIAAVNAFSLSYFKTGGLQKEKREATARLTKKIKQTESYLDAAYEKLERISEVGRNEQLGNVIMANLGAIAPRSEFVDLENFYTGQSERIRLKPDLSPVKNAEAYFRKGKNEKVEIARLDENIRVRESTLTRIKEWLVELEKQESVRDLRQFLKRNEVFGGSDSAGHESEERFRKEIYMGYTIYIGKNARNNDELTLKLAGKEDLWLHAKDVSGSHVVIRQIAGRKIPAAVIERAAELAAWHSRRRTDSLCPVTVTPKKFVRKAKGMAPGAVVVEKESVVMVVPKG